VAIFGGDPVASGLVASLNRPGGNVTGISNLTVPMEAKRLGLLRDLVPQATSFGVLLNPTLSMAADQLKEVEEAARSFGLPLQLFRASTDGGLEAAFESIAAKTHPCGLGRGRFILQFPAREARGVSGAPRDSRDLQLSRLRRGRRSDELRNRSS
jgi:hypothetical protein